MRRSTGHLIVVLLCFIIAAVAMMNIRCSSLQLSDDTKALIVDVGVNIAINELAEEIAYNAAKDRPEDIDIALAVCDKIINGGVEEDFAERIKKYYRDNYGENPELRQQFDALVASVKSEGMFDKHKVVSAAYGFKRGLLRAEKKAR
jgi:hypothetical protein